jgi:hypothetical protein
VKKAEFWAANLSSVKTAWKRPASTFSGCRRMASAREVRIRPWALSSSGTSA